MKYVISLTWSIFLLLAPISLLAQQETPAVSSPKYDISREPVLYTVGYAHLDTEWRWDYEETINVYLKRTLDDNFQRIEKFKPYVFTFSGAKRYKLMKEYYPEKYDRMKKYIAQGRWFVGGSSVDECDANIPSPESIIRQVLYGNGYFRSEFGKESIDFLLPDCFGFQASLPSALSHAGLTGFSTQKLVWGSAIGIPFNVGNWVGPDGKGVVAALNATDYTGRVQPRLDTSSYWSNRINENGKKYGLYADYRYYGVGDVGGAPREEDVKNLTGSIGQPGSRFTVYPASSDQLFRDITPAQRDALPSYSGDLLLTEHSAGSLTSQAYMKRWNRKNELLAQVAEPLATAADWLGALPYPRQRINNAWWLVLGSQMHDILPGTSIPKAYEYAWNDEVLAMNLFAGVAESSAGAVIRSLDTRGPGIPVAVYNPIAMERTDPVEAEVLFSDGTPGAIKVVDGDGTETPVQILSTTKTTMRILFMATVPSMGFAVYNVVPVKNAAPAKSMVTAGKSVLENEQLRVVINAGGDIQSITDKQLGKELLTAPARLEFLREHPAHWPAWNMDWKDRKKPAIGYVDGPATITLLENGPIRATYRIERSARNSTFVQEIRLYAGKGAVIVKNRVNWQSRGVSLKASFPLTASNPEATYNLGLGTITRGNNMEKKYEVPSREWFDLTDKSGTFGVTILEDCKFGSDKPSDKVLRLTLLYTPRTNSFFDQATQDWGIHEFAYAIYPHKGDWRAGKSPWKGRAFNQPLRCFQVTQHEGFYGKRLSLARLSSAQADITALKSSENGASVIVRLQELTGKEAKGVELIMAGKILKAYEVDGQERRLAEAVVQNGKLISDFGPYAIRTFALTLEPPAAGMTPPVSIELPLPFDQDVVSGERLKNNGGFGQSRINYPAELFPDRIKVDGVDFKMGLTVEGKKNALACSGQKIMLPGRGKFNQVCILAAALTDTAGTFRVGGTKAVITVQAYQGMIGQFDNRRWDRLERIKALDPGFIKRDEVAHYATHQHRDSLNLPYRFLYIYKYCLPADSTSGTLQLPDNEAIKIFAITAVNQPNEAARPTLPLYDDFTGRPRMVLNLPRSYVDDQMEPVATITFANKGKLTELPARLTMRDYADLHQPNGVTATYYHSGSDTNLRGIASGMAVPGLNDGMFELLPTDSLNDRWSEGGEGRLVMDLQKELELDSLHLFAVQATRLGAQSFSLWTATGEKMPAVTGDPKASGWTFVALSPPRDTWGSNKALYTIKPVAGKIKPMRYLMWISEDSAHGPYYFREVDVFEKEH